VNITADVGQKGTYDAQKLGVVRTYVRSVSRRSKFRMVYLSIPLCMRPMLLQNEVEEMAMATGLLCMKLMLIQKEAKIMMRRMMKILTIYRDLWNPNPFFTLVSKSQCSIQNCFQAKTPKIVTLSMRKQPTRDASQQWVHLWPTRLL
jgi:hypothetical protein